MTSVSEVLRLDQRVEEIYGPLKPYHSRPQSEGFVYLIRSEKGGPVKIGWARDPDKRCSDLQTAHPYRLAVIARFPGSLKLERELHERFAAVRIPGGEWFEPIPEILELVIRRCM